LISHDRALLASTCEQLLVLDGEGGVEVVLDVESWLAAPSKEVPVTPDEAPRGRSPRKKPERVVSTAKKETNPLRSLSIRNLESAIDEHETRLAAIDAELIRPEVYSDGDAMKALTAERKTLAELLSPLEQEWERRADGSR
jgi:ATPase subunit of ABC transporter with duplicated ATPase domains